METVAGLKKDENENVWIYFHTPTSSSAGTGYLLPPAALQIENVPSGRSTVVHTLSMTIDYTVL